MSQGDVSILIVDDDEDMRGTLSTFIGRMGVKVATAIDVTSATNLLLSRIPAFDVVLTDLKLPGGSGLDIVRVAHERSRDCLVTIVTGYGSLETAIEAIRLGAYDYVTKPFSLDEIGVQVRNMIERVSLAKENARLSIRLQQLYEELNRLQSERTDMCAFQEEIRRELRENRLKLDQVVAWMQRGDPRPLISEAPVDRIAVSGMVVDPEVLDMASEASLPTSAPRMPRKSYSSP
jgi:DNA-binding NtrC family response regulator